MSPRELSLTAAVHLHSGHCCTGETVLATATAFHEWLTATTALLITIGSVIHQDTGHLTLSNPGGNPMQLHDDEQVDLTVSVASRKGNPIPDDPATTEDDLTWTVADPTVASLLVSPDTRTCTVVAGVTGSTVVTVAFRELAATLAVDVVPGAAALLTITEGDPVDQPA